MGRQLEDENIITIRAMYHGGYTIKQIALSMGVSASTASKYLVDITEQSRKIRREKRLAYEANRKDRQHTAARSATTGGDPA